MRSDPLPVGGDLSLVEGVDLVGSVEGVDLVGSVEGVDLVGSVESADDASAVVAAGDHDDAHDTPVVTATPQRKQRRSGGLVADIPLALVICGVGVGLVVIAMHHFRWGNLAISISVLAGAFFRLVLPARKAGLLVVRSRFTDVVTMGIIGGTLMLLAAVTST